VPTRTTTSTGTDNPVIERLYRRMWPILVSVVYVGLGSAFFFRWGSLVRHTPSLWISPADLTDTYRASVALAHGHVSAIYQRDTAFITFPGFLVALVPLGALSNVFHTTFVEIMKNHHVVTQMHYLVTHTTRIWPAGTVSPTTNHTDIYAIQPQWFVFTGPYSLILSCAALFAFDALAERLQVTRSRRAVLTLAEIVVLWPVVVSFGHPEDAVSVALAVYALIFALDGRFTGAGWLFGAAVAVQPLVVVMFPLLLVVGGRERALGLVLRGIGPAAVVTVGPMATEFHTAFHDLVAQPTYPYVSNNHQTPWTSLAPKLGGKGGTTTVGGGPPRVVALVVAAGLGWWARRWRDRPEMLVWTAALVLSLRTYTESVMTAYYVWPALAVGLVVAARCSSRRFGIAVAAAVGTTICAQWHLGWLAWWAIDVGGLSALLIAAVRPRPPAVEELQREQERERERERIRAAVAAQSRSKSGTSKAKKRKARRTDRKRSSRH